MYAKAIKSMGQFLTKYSTLKKKKTETPGRKKSINYTFKVKFLQNQKQRYHKIFFNKQKWRTL